MSDTPKTFGGDLADPPSALSSLCLQDRWVTWRWELGKNGKWTKPPYIGRSPSYHASTSDAQTWGSRRDAVLAVLSGKMSGVGFCLKDSDIGAIDLDKCRNPETTQIDDWAQSIINSAAGAYVEVTPSGEGLRIIGVAGGPETHRKFVIAHGREGAAVEVYRKATRFITISGLEIGNCTTLPNIDGAINQIVSQFERVTESKPKPNESDGNGFDDIEDLIEHGAPEPHRSEAFSRCVWSLAGQGLNADQIENLLQKHPTGIAAKYINRLRKEIDRCYDKWRRQNSNQAQAESSVPRGAAVLVRAGLLEPESIDWAWRNRFAFGKLALIAGDPGLGKSTILIDIVARHSVGEVFPVGEGRAQQCESVILTAEDGLRDTCVPRLIAAGADLSKVYFLTGTMIEGAVDEAMFDLAKDIAALRRAFKANPNIRIFVIDPLTAYLGAGTKAKENAEVRRVLAPLVKLAEDLGVCVLVNSHLNKGAGKALYRVLDSIAFIALGRTVHLVVRDADNPDNIKFICDKTNIGSRPLGLTYLVQKTWITAPKTGEEIETSRISWGTQHIDESADEALSPPEKPDPTMTSDAVELLRIVLANGPMAVADIEREARAARLLGEDQELRKSKPFQSAKKILGIATHKSDFAGGWTWSLTPSKATKAP
jgi:AAA domain-containing protein